MTCPHNLAGSESIGSSETHAKAVRSASVAAHWARSVLFP